MHILLIDDSSSTRSLLRTLINSGQAVRHEISEASSGEESLQKVGSGEITMPDLIIMDINMGGMTGYELCREFRQRYGKGSDISPYIIIVTANEGVEVITQALDSGANDYMPKPVNVKVLHVRLRVAERLLAQAASGGGTAPAAPAPAAPVDNSAAIAEAVAAAIAETTAKFENAPKEVENAPVDPQTALIAWAVDQVEAPVALVATAGQDSTFQILYANGAMMQMTGSTQEQLLGNSLLDLEAWTPDFVTMANGYIERGASLSHVPLWSKTRQEFPVYLSFFPVPSGEELIKHYLVIHHI